MSANRFDTWLDQNGPVAVTIREELEPVMGKDSVFFPPTFASPKGSDEPPTYVIDETGAGKIALVDTVGSQANRMEPLFKQEPYSKLVPKVTIKIGERELNLLDAGHRAADAVVRFSNKWSTLRDAFLDIRQKGSATALAKVAPTSILFRVWDSRETQVKLPRLIGSTIRAFKVEKLTRSAQFFAATEKHEIEELGTQDFLSNVGLDDAPAGRTAGGVVSRGGIQRDAVLNLVALRSLAGDSPEETIQLRRYILGLALVVLVTPSQRFLREGCLLVPREGLQAEPKLVERSGEKQVLTDLTEDAALKYAQEAAAEFVVGAAWTALFDKEAVKKSAEAKKELKPKKAK